MHHLAKDKPIVGVVDGKGGGMGAAIVSKLRAEIGEKAQILALGTNAMATSAMLKAGADQGASGPNAVCWNVPKCHIVCGPIGIVIPNAIMGEITPEVAAAIVASPAHVIVLPTSKCEVELGGIPEISLPALIDALVRRVAEIVDSMVSSGAAEDR